MEARVHMCPGTKPTCSNYMTQHNIPQYLVICFETGQTPATLEGITILTGGAPARPQKYAKHSAEGRKSDQNSTKYHSSTIKVLPDMQTHACTQLHQEPKAKM